MFRTHKPINVLWDSLHASMTGFILPPEPASDACPLFDFRSRGFHDDALALAGATGCEFELCRQALFMAHGDCALALEILMLGHDGAARRQIVH